MNSRASNLTNQQFGQLLVLAPTDERNHNKTIIWKCKCLNCGQEAFVPSTKLRAGEVKSCGCMEHIREPSTPPGTSGFTYLYKQYKQNAQRRNLIFNLTKTQFREFVTGSCSYCGVEPLQVMYGHGLGTIRTHGTFLYNGIDRIDNKQGYHVENCTTCCGKCNKAKMVLSEKDFIEMIVKIYRNMNLHDYPL